MWIFHKVRVKDFVEQSPFKEEVSGSKVRSDLNVSKELVIRSLDDKVSGSFAVGPEPKRTY